MRVYKGKIPDAAPENVIRSGYDKNLYGEYAWFSPNSEDRTHPVKLKKPNQFGLNDMHGNVSEWCLDYYDSDYYKKSPTRNPKGPNRGRVHVIRGTSWGSNMDTCDFRGTPGHRFSPNRSAGNWGFRIARNGP